MWRLAVRCVPSTQRASFTWATRAYAAAPAPAAPGMDQVWELWSEGNLFSLSVTDLQSFLTSRGVDVDPRWKKTALVKQVEEIVTSEQRNASRKLSSAPQVPKKAEVAAPADVYGELAVDTAFEAKGDSFVDVQQSGLYSGESMGPVVPRAFQVMHENICPDVLISRINTSAFPGGNSSAQAYTLVPTSAKVSNRTRFHKAFQWCVMNLWNMNMDGEVHVSVGKLLMWKSPAVERDQMTLWTAQQQLQAEQPYSWLSIAHENNKADVEAYCAEQGFTVDPNLNATNYRVSIKRQNDFLEAELDDTLSTTSLNRSWERFLVTYYMRTEMPDVRVQLRARLPLKKKVADQFSGVSILKKDGDTLSSAVPPELGEVVSAVERQSRGWTRMTSVNVPLTLTESTSRIVVSKKDVGEPRQEYELICRVPPQHEKVDLSALSEEVWDTVTGFPKILQKGMSEFGCTPKV